ncbi:RNA polymerase sigma factor (sigma-70 family) [Kineothrix alysoides]|uniref:RNA polymerase sigma factor (Sigma-70 family) n=1 Tax=Kineothrix alysoides TaxID=1469948 RepID=A0A4R1QQQ7_9FIRM|nr:sigma-70 family RNA polymerase sigma factor [Kineothrix alysoides]TCL55233.1 RNA polymerase sigma factor (sigma-70 family) [Kineothrix alysoides]
MLKDLIIRAQESDSEAMMELINKFKPLLQKYARKLVYEDAYEDLVLYFIQLMHGLELEKLLSNEDGSITNYINVSVRNFYNKKIPEIIRSKKEILHTNLSEEQLYYIDTVSAKTDKIDFLYESGIHQILNESEYQIIYLIYVEGYTAVEIAKIINKSRQAVNQMKVRALIKLRDKLLSDIVT